MTRIFKRFQHWQIILCLLLIIGLVTPFRAVRAVAGQVDANNVASAPTIDGNLSETSWNLATSASKSSIGTPNNTITLGASWDNSNLYVAVKVLDSNLFNDSANTWEDDSVEIYIDANHNRGTTYDSFDRQFVKGYNDTSLSSIGSTTGVVHAVAAISGGYTIEMSIPWSNLGVSPSSGMLIGFDIGNNDDDNGGTRESQTVWWGNSNNYNNTSAFGDLMLMGGAPTPTRTLTAVSGTTNTPTATLTTGQSAYPSGVAWAIPGTIQAENYDLGGETVAYHDSDVANTGGQYRTGDGVDIEATSDTGGGFNVGWTQANEWLEYTVNVAAAGNYTLTERVASGAGGGSFRIEFNSVDKTGAIATPNTGGWQTYQTLTQTVNLSAGVQIMRIYFTGNDTNLNYVALAAPGITSTPTMTATITRTPTVTATSPVGQSAYPSGVAWAVPGTIQAENFDLGGESIAYHDNETLNQGGQYRTEGVDIEATSDTGGGFNVGWMGANEWLEYTINVSSPGNYTLTERLASPNSGSSFRVEFNSVDKTGTVIAPNTGGWQTYQSISQTVNLSAGIQIMRIYIVAEGFNLNHFTLTSGSVTATPTPTSPAPAGRGATLPYIEYEAENNSGTNGAAVGPSRTWTTIASESSGRRAIQLNSTGQFVQWTSSQQANSVVVRYVIPDAAGGGGTTATISLYVNNVFRQKINLNSHWAWVYGAWADNPTAQWSNNPGSGSPHKFYDEARALVGDIPAGATVKLQRDSNDTAAYYVVDLIDLEQVAPALSMPAGFISITSCGATPNDGTNDSPAIQNCINNARSQGQGVWIPAGTFNSFSASLDANNATIRGAGMWYSTIDGGNARFNCGGGVCKYYDFAILGDTTNRNDTTADNGFEGTAGSGSRLERIWIEHTKCGYWVGTNSNNLVITGSRLRNMFADGVNFYNGSSNSVVEQTHLRNMGDDALASWSPTTGGVNTNNIFRFNTIQNTWFAHGIAIYGGTDNKIQDNVVLDQVTMGGIFIAQAFGSHLFAGTTLVQRNTLIRTGGDQWGQQQGALKIGPEQGSINGVQISDILIQDSTYSGLWFSPGCAGCTTNGVQVSNVQIQNSGTVGIHAQSGGFGNFSFVTVTNGGLNNGAGFNFIKGAGNTGW